jgi:mono/diheme cytochrome c family protein
LHDGRRAFWIIKHGIKMSAMPAWSKALDDGAIWELVSFVQKMPDMTPETYRKLTEVRSANLGLTPNTERNASQGSIAH